MFSTFIAHAGWHWMLDRGVVIARFPLPTLDAVFLASLMRSAMAALIFAALLWLAIGFVRRFMQRKDSFADKAFAKVPVPKRG